MEKHCNGCDRTLPLSEFHRDNSGRRKFGVVTRCKECMSRKSAAYRARPGVQEERNRVTAAWVSANKDRVLAREAKRRLDKRAQCLVANARTRAKKRGIHFDLDGAVDDIQARIDADRCELTGTPFDLSPGRKFNSPSIDRIDPKLGYIPGNIRVVCHAMNAAMGDWGEGPVWEMFQNWAATASSRRSRKRS
jgi:hypothetical protein